MNLTEWSTLDIDIRVQRGRSKEEDILNDLENHFIELADAPLDYAYKASDEDDKHNKIDAWLVSKGGEEYSAQIKYRESGRDFGAAVIMPYYNFARFCTQFDSHTLPWDRDARGEVDYYICLSDNSRIFMFISRRTVMSAIAKSIAKVRFEGFGGNTFKHEALPGIELKIVKDRGAGYSEGQSKIIVYMSPEYIASCGDYVRIKDE